MAYSVHRDLPVDVAAQTVAAGDSLTFDLLDEELPGGLIAGRDFHTQYEGSLRFESSTGNQTYRLDVTTTHALTAGGDSVEFYSTRTYYFRATRNSEVAIPMDVFSSVSQVALGSFQPEGGGDPIEITQEMLDGPVEITVDAELVRVNSAEWALTRLVGQNVAVTYWQSDPVPDAAQPWPTKPELVDEDIPADVARDAEVSDAVAAEEAAREAADRALAERVSALEAAGGGGGQRQADGSPYATVDMYRSRTGSQADDDVVVALIAAAGRYIDRRLGWAPGSFSPQAEATVRLWPRRSSRVLRLRDPAGQQLAVRSWSRIAADYSGRGEPDRVWTPEEDGEWVRLEPDSGGSWPGRSIRLWESHADATESAWPSDPGCVDLTYTPGFAATPGPVAELSIHVARSMADLHQGGAAAVVSALESPVPLSSDGERLWRRVEMEFSAGRPGRLGVVVSAAGSRR